MSTGSYFRILRRAIVLSAAPVVSILGAQDCPDLAPLPAPVIEECKKESLLERAKNAVGAGCAGRNERRRVSFTRLSRGFMDGLEYQSSVWLFTKMDDEPVYVTVDSLRGCRGETINIVIEPQTVTSLEYQLSASNDVIIDKGRIVNWRGDRILGPSVTLPQSGYYTIIVRTVAPAKQAASKQKDGTTRYVTSYPRAYIVKFKTDAGTAPLEIGAVIDETVSGTQPFVRRVRVPGGSKVRFRFASMGTGTFIATVLRGTGEQLHQSSSPKAFDEVLAVTPTADETFTLRVIPAGASQTVGIQLSVIDDNTSGARVTSGNRISSVFKLPAQYDYERNADHRSIYATETARLLYRSGTAEQLRLLVIPSGATGLIMRVRIFDEVTEEVIIDVRVDKSLSIPVSLPAAGDWVIALSPVSASELLQAGEARYTAELRKAP